MNQSVSVNHLIRFSLSEFACFFFCFFSREQDEIPFQEMML